MSEPDKKKLICVECNMEVQANYSSSYWLKHQNVPRCLECLSKPNLKTYTIDLNVFRRCSGYSNYGIHIDFENLSECCDSPRLLYAHYALILEKICAKCGHSLKDKTKTI